MSREQHRQSRQKRVGGGGGGKGLLKKGWTTRSRKGVNVREFPTYQATTSQNKMRQPKGINRGGI